MNILFTNDFSSYTIENSYKINIHYLCKAVTKEKVYGKTFIAFEKLNIVIYFDSSIIFK